jgi:MYXO-CTERM domain-containing protein
MAPEPDGRPEPGPDASIDDLQSDIERTREELGETVGALSEKLDVKTRAEQTVQETKDAVAQRSQEVAANIKEKPAVPVGALLAVVALVGLVVWRRRRHKPA